MAEVSSKTIQNSPLLNLPPELRNSIYHLVLISDKGEPVDISLKIIKPLTAILRVCSQIRTEATQVFYAANKFRISDFLRQQSEIDRFVRNAGDSIKFIREVSVRITLPQMYEKMVDISIMSRTNSIDQETQAKLGEAARHVWKVTHDTILHNANKLLNTALPPHHIRLEMCSFDPNAIPTTKDYVIGFATATAEVTFNAKILKGVLEYAKRKWDVDFSSDEDEDKETDDETDDDSDDESDSGDHDEGSDEEEGDQNEESDDEVEGDQ